MSSSPLFHVRNKHSAVSGEPPSIDGNIPGRYHAYFENAQGEQLIFIYDRAADTGTLGKPPLESDQTKVERIARIDARRAPHEDNTL